MNKQELVETRILENGGETFHLLLSSRELEQHSSDCSFLQLVIIFGTGLIFLPLHRYMGNINNIPQSNKLTDIWTFKELLK